ncbi:MAG: acyltransferase [Clostridiales bacterium]|nr:acyltransferase [Clostridiales bacterium]
MTGKEMVNVMSGNRNFMLDFLKGIACIGVVFIHVRFPKEIGIIVEVLSRFAVPIFFMISGYFAYSEHGNIQNVIIKRMKRIFMIMVYALILYMLFTLMVGTYEHSLGDVIHLLSYISVWIKMLIFGDFDIFFLASHLWFLLALLYAYLVLYIIDRRNLYKLAYKCIPFLFALRVMVCIISETYDVTWHIRSNFFIFALPYLLLGNYIAHDNKMQRRCRNNILFILIICGAVFSVVCVLADWKVKFAEIGTSVYCIALFLLAIKYPHKSISRKMEILGNTYSLYVYIVHNIVSFIIDSISAIMAINNTTWYLWSKPILVVLVSISVGVVWHKCLCLFHIKFYERKN